MEVCPGCLYPGFGCFCHDCLLARLSFADIFFLLTLVLHSAPLECPCSNLLQLFNECGAAVWGTSFTGADSLELHARWGILSQDVRDVEVVWSPVHRDALGQLLLEQLQVGFFTSQLAGARWRSQNMSCFVVYPSSRKAGQLCTSKYIKAAAVVELSRVKTLPS